MFGSFIYPINNQCSPLNRNQSAELQCRSIGWFLYDREHWSLMGKFKTCIRTQDINFKLQHKALLYLEFCETSKMELFAKMVDGFHLLIIFF